jgi:hypothetical protein
MMLRSVLSRHSFLPFLSLMTTAYSATADGLDLEGQMLYLIQQFLHILLAPDLVDLYLVLPHQKFSQLLLSFRILSRSFLNLTR